MSYVNSAGASALAGDGNDMGSRLAHDLRFGQARDWAEAQFAGDPARLSRYLCELAMFSDVYGAEQDAEALFLQALDLNYGWNGASSAILSATLAHAFGTLNCDFAMSVLRKLPEGERELLSVDLKKGTIAEAIPLPTGVGVPLAEDLVSTVLLVHFSRAIGDVPRQLSSTKALLEQLGAYREAVLRSNGSGALMSLSNMTLMVLAQLGLRARRRKESDALDLVRSIIYFCLSRFRWSLSELSLALQETLAKIGVRERNR